MGSVNKVLLLGRLGQDIELRYTPNGDAVGNCNMATSETWKDKSSGERKEKTEWHRLVIWGRRAEGLKDYLLKGTQIYVEGRLQTRQWEAKDGGKRSTTEIRVDNIEFVGGGRGASDRPTPSNTSGNHDEPSGAQGSSVPPQELTDDDIPF
ncbi:MAG: single-stranded DNA-binding protein [Acidobacteriota bacterium]|nr:single-stranded DNA-binding protein [Acidobacteriota bacterium]